MTNATRKITGPQSKALDWLNDHSGEGLFTKDGGAVIAAGEQSPATRATWIALRDALRITITGNRLVSLTNRETPAFLRNSTEHGSPIYGGSIVKSLPGAE